VEGVTRTGPVEQGPPPLLVVRPRRPWLPSNPRELFLFRGLLARFAARDLTLRYRQTLLGMVWVVLQPLLGAGVLSFVFGGVAGLKGPAGMPYFVFSFAGMLAWTLFSSVLSRCSSVLVGNASMIQKVFFPRVLLPFSQVLSALVDVCVSLVVMAILLVAYGIWAGPAIVLVPVWLLLFVLLALGVGLATGALAVKYRDVQYIIPVAVQLLLFATPIAYLVSAAPASKRWLFDINPLTGLFEAIRWSILGTPAPAAWNLLYGIVGCLVVFAGGLVTFSKLEHQFADVV
jgi:lipopolysaccharide transport system permease protein